MMHRIRLAFVGAFVFIAIALTGCAKEAHTEIKVMPDGTKLSCSWLEDPMDPLDNKQEYRCYPVGNP